MKIAPSEVFQRSTDTSVRISRSLSMFPQEIVTKFLENDPVWKSTPPSPPPHPINPLSGQISSSPPLVSASPTAKSGAEGEGERECRSRDRAWKGERSGGEQQRAAESVVHFTTIGGGFLDSSESPRKSIENPGQGYSKR